MYKMMANIFFNLYKIIRNGDLALTLLKIRVLFIIVEITQVEKYMGTQV